MTISEILKAKGLDDNAVNGILDEMKTNKLFISGEENLDIRYGKLKTQHEGTAKQLEEAQTLIEQLKKSTKGQEDAQKQIAAHEEREKQLLAELEKTRILSEAKVNLLAEGALDIDYLLYKLQEKGELALGDDGKIKDWDDKVAPPLTATSLSISVIYSSL